MNHPNESTSHGSLGAPTARRLLLALVLALLAVLITIVTANAYVAVKIEDTLADFDRGIFNYTGLLDLPGIQSVQLLPVGLTALWTISDQPLLSSLAYLAAIANGRVLYVVGGYDQDVSNAVYSSIITGPQGVLTPWQVQRPLPEPRAGAGIAVHPGSAYTSTLYIVGGFDSLFAATNTIYRAEIDDVTGEIIGDWVADDQPLPQQLAGISVIVFDGFLYVMGGFDGGSSSFDTVHYARIRADGSLEPFAQTAPLPKPLWDGYAVVYEGQQDTPSTMYYIGGVYLEGSTSFPTEQVFFADFLSGGGLSPWEVSDGDMPRPLYAHSGVLVGQGEIILTGGIGNPLNPGETFTSSVKAALVDPDNPSFRLFNWCDIVPDPSCEFGAWQTGASLPEVRALHGTVGRNSYIYVLGGQNEQQDATNTVFIGRVTGSGALYAPKGFFRSQELNLGQSATLRRITWEASIAHPGEMGLTMQYRTRPVGGSWSQWSAPVPSQHGSDNVIELVEPPTNTHYVQYQASFTTVLTYSSPRLDKVEIYYEVEDPDLSVSKDTGDVITVALGNTVQYSIRYTNTGGWVAEGAILTETLPEYTSYVTSAGWHQVGSSDVYTYGLGDVQRGTHGSVDFRVRVDDDVPPATYFITNRVDAAYPAMIDAFGQTIVDPEPDDNWHEFSNPLSFFALALSKEADPPAGSTVTPGSRLTYTVRYENVGAIPASQIVLTDTFDPFGNYTVISPPLPPTATEHVWYLPGLPPRETREITIVVQLDDPMPNYWPITNRASLDSAEGDPYHTPEVTHTVMNLSGTELAPMVDLIITDVYWLPAEPVSGTWPGCYATVVNTGTADAEVPFQVSLYVKPELSDPPKWPSDQDRGYCLHNCATERPNYVAQVDQLAAGESTVVSFQDLDKDPSPDFPAAGTYDIYVQADVVIENGNPYWGSYAEDNESNNIWRGSLTVIPVAPPPKVYLPLISKDAR